MHISWGIVAFGGAVATAGALLQPLPLAARLTVALAGGTALALLLAVGPLSWRLRLLRPDRAQRRRAYEAVVRSVATDAVYLRGVAARLELTPGEAEQVERGASVHPSTPEDAPRGLLGERT